MPIGLPDRGDRKADTLARAVIGPLWPRGFQTPVRQALQAPDHATASAINRELTGHGISIQAFGLKPKLFEVEEWARHTTVRVVETHPEVCYARQGGSSLTLHKSSWAGGAQSATISSGGRQKGGSPSPPDRRAPLVTCRPEARRPCVQRCSENTLTRPYWRDRLPRGTLGPS